jgi:tRNA nucleotidyltransferase/poly(A) polymerase
LPDHRPPVPPGPHLLRPKIIETSTFRANPRELEDDDSEGTEAETGDLLIRRDNVFGTPEQDARRRDFTINGLFYDLETGHVIDHVSGMATSRRASCGRSAIPTFASARTRSGSCGR